MSADPVSPPTGQTEAKAADLESVLAGLARNYNSLSPRLREIEHSVACECTGVKLRVHFPSIVQGKATIYELVEVIIHFLPWFALPRTELVTKLATVSSLPPDEALIEASKLSQSARDLFIKAHKATQRTGEAGEFLLSILTEWVLQAPQLIAKMSLKTSRAMPVHGSDGIHGRFSAAHKTLTLFWGESKVHADVKQAIRDAIESIVEANKPEKQQHEIKLVARYIDFAGLDDTSKKEFLRFLDPFDEASNNKTNTTTCLIAFNSENYTKVAGIGANAENKFRELVQAELHSLSAEISRRLKAENIENQLIELFLLPVPSVEDLRKAFQAKIGWLP